jgi:hypothetical protein
VDFALNEALLAEASRALGGCDGGGAAGVRWVIGGACAGKSSVCRALAERYGLAVYDMDGHIYGSWMGAYQAERHPASVAWFSAPNPLEWALSLSWPEFDALNRASTAEYLDVLAADPVLGRPDLLLIDGGVTHPSVLARALPAASIFCLNATEAERVKTWETSPARSAMKEEILALPNPIEMWQKFLYFDRMIAETLEEESRANGIPRLVRDGATPLDTMVDAVARHFRFTDT